MHPRMPLAFLAARAHCWLIVNLSSTRTPRFLSAELLSSRSIPSLYWCMGLFLPRCRTLHLPLLNLIRFLSAQLSSLSRCHWMAAQPAWCIYHSSQFCVISKLGEVHSNSSSRSLMNKLNKTGPSTDPWGTPLVTSLQLDSVPLMTTLWVLPFSQFSIHCTDHSSSPQFLSFPRRMLWETCLLENCSFHLQCRKSEIIIQRCVLTGKKLTVEILYLSTWWCSSETACRALVL